VRCRLSTFTAMVKSSTDSLTAATEASLTEDVFFVAAVDPCLPAASSSARRARLLRKLS
jgi:hypothetical protein